MIDYIELYRACWHKFRFAARVNDVAAQLEAWDDMEQIWPLMWKGGTWGIFP